MNNMLKYTKMLLLFVLVLGLTSCDSEEETEYNLPGEWYTSEEIDFGAYTWGRGTIMTFNARNRYYWFIWRPELFAFQMELG